MMAEEKEDDRPNFLAKSAEAAPYDDKLSEKSEEEKKKEKKGTPKDYFVC